MIEKKPEYYKKKLSILKKKDIAAAIKEIHNREAMISMDKIALLLEVSERTVYNWVYGKHYATRAIRTNILKLLKEVRLQRWRDVREVNSPVGILYPDPDEMEIIREQEQKKKTIKKLEGNSIW